MRTAAFRSAATYAALPHQRNAIKHIIVTEMKESSVRSRSLTQQESVQPRDSRPGIATMQVEQNAYFIGFLIPHQRERQVRQAAPSRRAS